MSSNRSYQLLGVFCGLVFLASCVAAVLVFSL